MRSLGFDNSMETMRVLDIAMNPNSLYLDRKRSVNSHVGSSSREQIINARMHVTGFDSPLLTPPPLVPAGQEALGGWRLETSRRVLAGQWLKPTGDSQGMTVNSPTIADTKPDCTGQGCSVADL